MRKINIDDFINECDDEFLDRINKEMTEWKAAGCPDVQKPEAELTAELLNRGIDPDRFAEEVKFIILESFVATHEAGNC